MELVIAMKISTEIDFPDTSPMNKLAGPLGISA